jgi:LysM repeat protein
LPGRAQTLQLDADLISVTSITNGDGSTIPPTSYFVEPVNYGPPYSWIEINRASSAAFTAGNTDQRAITIVGLWGHRNDERAAGQLTASITTETTITVTSGSAIGVGQIIRVDSERMIVTGRQWATTGQTLTQPMTSNVGDTLFEVASTAGYTADETLLVGTEIMLIAAVASATGLIVKRAWDGTIPAAHAASDPVSASRTLTASHSNGAAIAAWQPPALIEQLAVAEALTTIAQERSGYARVSGADAAMEVTGKGLIDLRHQVRVAYGRQIRTAAV